MKHARDARTQHLAARVCWQVARRDDTRIARRRYRKPVVDGVYRLDDGAVWDDCLHVWPAVGVMTRLEQAHGAAIPREMVPVVQAVLR